MNKKALILVDLQNDFCHGGSLAVPGGEAVVPLANQLQTYFELIIATQDWHPHDHTSFASNHPGYSPGDVISLNYYPQILWPNHCEQHSQGAEFHPHLNTSRIKKIFQKGIDKNIDSYSAFYDNEHLRNTGLGDYLRSEQVQEVFILGLATDYCVKYSVLDACREGFKVYVIADACRGVELKVGDAEMALKEMAHAGAQIISSKDILQANQ